MRIRLAVAVAAASLAAVPAASAQSSGAVASITGTATEYWNVNAFSRTPIGDFNGDGRDDLAFASSEGPRVWVQVVFGQALLPSLNVNALTTPGQRLDVRIDPPQSQSNLHVSAVGDVNGDGRADLGVVTRGQALVVLGAPGTEPLRADQGGPRVLRLRTISFGYTGIGPAGDVNGDGKDDYLVRLPADAYGNTRGDTYLVRGGQASQDGLRIGYRDDITAAGDVDGDGRDDLLSGETTLLTHFDAAAPGLVRRSALKDGATVVEIVRPGGDVDGDGLRDLVVRRSGAYYPEYVVAGRAALGAGGDVPVGTLRPLPAQTAGWAGVGDLDGDGRDELGANNALLPGRSGTSGWTLSDVRRVTTPFGGPNQSAKYGWSAYLTPVGDLEGDGKDDLVAIGDRWATESVQPGGGLAPTGPYLQPNCASRGIVRIGHGEADRLAPELIGCQGLALFRTQFAVGTFNSYVAVGTRISFEMDEAATVRIAIRLTAGGTTRTHVITGKRGANTVTWDGRVAGVRLPVGSYTAVATPVDAAGNAGAPITRTFKITG